DRDVPGRDNVRPGLHVFGADAARYEVTWWDPRRLALDAPRRYGLRREDLIQDPGRPIAEADRRRYDEWRAGREAAQQRGGRPSLTVRAATEWARATPVDDETAARAEGVALVVAARGASRPAGPRFGTLVHAVLATVALDATADKIAEVVSLQARILGAPADEADAATDVVAAALGHPLMARARQAWRAGRCRREAPVTVRAADGWLIEGVFDLAFEEAAGWTVVDFKTDTEIVTAAATYRRQVALYASVIEKATGRPATAVLLQL